MVAQYRTTVHSKLPQAEAFRYMSEFSNARQWDPSVASSSKVTADDVGLGTAFDVATVFRGRRVELRYEITTYEAPRRVTLTALTPMLESRDTITFEPQGSGTDVTYDAYLALRGVRRVFDPLLGIFFKRIGDAAREGLERELNR